MSKSRHKVSKFYYSNDIKTWASFLRMLREKMRVGGGTLFFITRWVFLTSCFSGHLRSAIAMSDVDAVYRGPPYHPLHISWGYVDLVPGVGGSL